MYILETWNKDASIKHFSLWSYLQIRKPIKWAAYLTRPIRNQTNIGQTWLSDTGIKFAGLQHNYSVDQKDIEFKQYIWHEERFISRSCQANCVINFVIKKLYFTPITNSYTCQEVEGNRYLKDREQWNTYV